MVKTDPAIGSQPLKKAYDHFYGIMAGVLYRIDFPEKDKNEETQEKV